MTYLYFMTNYSPILCALINPATGKYYDMVANNWVDKPADHTVPPGAIIIPVQFETMGPTRFTWSWSTNIDPTALTGSALVIYQGIGKPLKVGDQIDLWPAPFYMPMPYTTGGWSRF